MSAIRIYGKRGRQLVFAHALSNAYVEWTDDKWTWGDLTAALYLGSSGLALAIPDPISIAIGWAATRASRSAVGAGSSAINLVTKVRNLPTFMKGGLASRIVWAAGVTHLLTLPWQIRDDQIRKEAEGVVDYMAAVPLEPGQSPPMNPQAWNPQGRAI